MNPDNEYALMWEPDQRRTATEILLYGLERIRPLSRSEYDFWMMNALPRGWVILSVPKSWEESPENQGAI